MLGYKVCIGMACCMVLISTHLKIGVAVILLVEEIKMDSLNHKWLNSLELIID